MFNKIFIFAFITVLFCALDEYQTKEEYYNKGLFYIQQENYESAFYYMKKASELGSVLAQNNLGVLYGLGHGTDVDIQRSNYWIEKAAHGGSAAAQNTLGCFYKDALNGFEQNYEKANYWFEKAAKQGCPFAQYNLAMAYRNVQGFEINFTEALKWFAESTFQGDEIAKQELDKLIEELKLAKEAMSAQ